MGRRSTECPHGCDRVLFGAQVAYAWQNRDAYIQEKQAESVNQRGKEFVALRLMTHIARNFSEPGL